MSERRSTRLPWVIWGGTLVALAGALYLSVLNGSFSRDSLFIPIAIAMMIGYTTVGALIASRERRNPTGWLLLTVGIGFLLAALSDEWIQYTYRTSPGSLPLGRFMGWLTNWVAFVAVIPIPIVFLLFPTGRLPSRRWRPVLWGTIGAFALGMLATLLKPGPINSSVGSIPNPTGVEGLRTALEAVQMAALVGGLAGALGSVVALVLRFRRAIGDERQQMRWLAYVGGLAVACLFAAMLSGIGLEGNETRLLNDLSFFAFFLAIGIGVPAAAAIAILRYRLWDLDVVIKKTVVFGVVATGLTLLALLLLLVLPVGVFGTGLSGWERGLLLVGVAFGLLIGPMRRVARRFADRIVYGRRATPYEVLTAFGERVGGAYSTEDVLPRMAEVLASGTGAISARVLLRVGSDLREVARSAGKDAVLGQEHTVPVLDQGEELGAIAVSMPANDPMDPAKEKLIRDLASQAGLVLRNARLVEELRASRRRLVAAQDVERRRLERNIHDGAQQQLVSLSVRLRLADQTVERDPAKAREILRQLQAEATDALENLRDLARGIYPPLLADEGLTAALRSQIRKVPIPVELVPDGVARYDEEVEAAVYFCCLEALQNVAKYAQATRVSVHLRHRDGELAFEVDDDGVGFDPGLVTRGLGLQGMADRLEAIGGRLSIRSSPGGGTTVVGVVPTGT